MDYLNRYKPPFSFVLFDTVYVPKERKTSEKP
jgi:hypothetical protein